MKKFLDVITDLFMWALVLSLLTLAACGPAGGSGGGSNSGTGSPRVIIFGDDISAGIGATTPYGTLVGQALGLPVVNKSCSVLNQSPGNYCLSNQTTNQQWYNSIGITSRDIVIFMTGYQDVRHNGNLLNIDGFVDFFLNELKATGAEVLVVSPIKMQAAQYTNFAPLNNGSDVQMQNLATYLQGKVTALADSHIKYIDVISGFNPINANLSADKQYPNDVGHQFLATTILGAM